MMCHSAKMLVQHSKFRYVAACSCDGGVVHLSWDVATLHLQRNDFQQLVTVVEELDRSKPMNHVWIGTVGLALSQADHAICHDMLQAAWLQLQAMPLDGICEPSVARVIN